LVDDGHNDLLFLAIELRREGSQFRGG
jgi:hypothetical protein